MKRQILSRLRENSEIVSGASMSATLGVSRVSVWKHIQRLRDLGYEIIGTPKGYRLINRPDVLFPWEFPGRESNVHYFDEVASTMEIAREMARANCPHFTVVIADRQTDGRGRLKRKWHSPLGGLYFTLILRPPIAPLFSARITFCASLTLAQTLQNHLDIPARVKWPNDILVYSQKVSGMLSEMAAEADQVTYINIGIGINVNNRSIPYDVGAISIKEMLNKKVSRKALLARFLDAFENRIDHTKLEHVIAEWKQCSATLNRQVRIVTRDEVFQGLAKDVDETGALILERSDGSIKKVAHGDCFHLSGRR